MINKFNSKQMEPYCLKGHDLTNPLSVLTYGECVKCLSDSRGNGYENSITITGEGSLGYNPYIFGERLVDFLNGGVSSKNKYEPEWKITEDFTEIFWNDYGTPNGINIEELMHFIKENKHWIE